jgi:CO/xanthine dehydrogenase Mo-binding subunit
VEEIRLVAGDTDYCPDSGITAGSRVTYIVGRSVQIAAEKLGEVLQGAAASMIGIDPEDLRLKDGFFYLQPRSRLSVGQVVRIEGGGVPAARRFLRSGNKPWIPKRHKGPFAYALRLEALVSVDGFR